MKYAPLLLLALLLAACQTPEQLAQQRAIQQEQDHATCLRYGFRPGSDAFKNCLLQLNIAREQRDYDNTRYHYYYGTGYSRHGGSALYYLGH